MSKTFVHNLGAFLRTTGAVVAVGFLPLVLPASSPWRGVQILSIGGAKWAESSTRMPAVTDSFSWYLRIPSRGLNA